MTAERGLAAALLLALGLVAYREIKAGQVPPQPKGFVGVALVFSLLGLLAIPAPGVAFAFAAVFDVALYLSGGVPVAPNLGLPGQPATKASQPFPFGPAERAGGGLQPGVGTPGLKFQPGAGGQ